MRSFALLLIFANLCFFGWAQFVDVPVPEHPVTAAENTSAPRLLLATERPSADASAKSGNTTPDTPNSVAGSAPLNDPTLKCVSVGPYQDLAGASQASASLQTAGFNTRQRIERGQLWVGYWVSVPNFASHAEAEQALQKLKAGGITDAYVLPGGEQSNVLSLGVFSEQTRAQHRVEEIRQLGLEPQISDRKREGSVYWIDVDLNEPGQAIDPSLLQSSGTIVRLEMRACPPT